MPFKSPALPARIAPDAEERLIRHVREGEPLYFTTALADALGASFDLAERIMLDVSGRQLAVTLVALGLRYTIIVVALERFFPHLAQGRRDERKSLGLLRGCSFIECAERVAAWRRADLTRREAVHKPHTVDVPKAPEQRPSNRAATANDGVAERQHRPALRRA